MPSSVCIGLVNPKSPANVGAVIRAAGCYGADAIRYTGTRFDRAARFHTDTKGIGARMPLHAIDDLTADLPPEMQIVCVELVEGATALPAFVHPDSALYIFGPEDSSLDQTLIDRAHAVVYIPTQGCMNLAATVNVVLYDRLAKSTAASGSDQLIRQSRDANNRVRVKTQARPDSR